MKTYNAGGDFPALKARNSLNVPRIAGGPASPVDGDLWIDSSANTLNFREDGVTLTLGLSTLDNEAVQDVVGAMFGDTATIDVTYNDAGNAISAVVLDSPKLSGQTLAQVRDFSQTTGTRLATGAVTTAASQVVLGRTTAGGGAAEELTQAQLRTLLALTSAQISDFTEAAQDAVGGILTDTATLDFTYDDTGNAITGAVLNSPALGGQTLAQVRDFSQTTGTRAATSAITQATARILGRVTAAAGGTEELTNAQVKTLLAIVAADISDFSAATVAAVNAAANIDADTLGGLTAAQIQTNVTSAIVNGAQATLDTLNELAAAIGNDANFATTMSTALGLRSRYFVATLGATSLTAGVADYVVTHNLGTKKINAQVWNIVTDWQEDALIQATSTNTATVRFEGTAIPAATYEVRIVTAA